MKLRDIILTIAIIILTLFVVIYGISVFYPAVNYDDYCPKGNFPHTLEKENDTICPTVCVPLYEIKNKECVFNDCGSGCGANGITTFETLKQCEIVASGSNCYEEYRTSQEMRSKIIFLIVLPLGIALLVLGGFLFGTEAVGAGLMGGGIGTILYGTIGYWRYSSDVLRFVLSLLGLIIVIYIAYEFNNKKKKKRFLFWKK
jgi:hypothetical protein